MHSPPLMFHDAGRGADEALTHFAAALGLPGHVLKRRGSYVWEPGRGSRRPFDLGPSEREARRALRGHARRRGVLANPAGDGVRRALERSYATDLDAQEVLMADAWRRGQVYPWVRANWPSLNKRNTISEYAEQYGPPRYADIQHRVDEALAWVTERVELSPGEWMQFANSLLTDRDWLAGKGGTVDLGDFGGRPLEGHGARLVIEVRDTEGRVLYVDPQGYNYARYVGFPLDFDPKPYMRLMPPAGAVLPALPPPLPPGAWVADLAERVDGRADRAQVARALRAVLKAARIPAAAYSLQTPNYSMASSIDVTLKDPGFAGRIDAILGTDLSHARRPDWPSRAGDSDRIHPFNRTSETDVYSDYHHPSGVWLPLEHHDVFVRELARVVAGDLAKAPRAAAALPGRPVARAAEPGDEVRFLTKTGEVRSRWLFVRRVPGTRGRTLQMLQRIGKRGHLLKEARQNIDYYSDPLIPSVNWYGRGTIQVISLSGSEEQRAPEQAAPPAPPPVAPPPTSSDLFGERASATQGSLFNPPHRRIPGKRRGKKTPEWERYKAEGRPTGQLQRAKKTHKTERKAWADVRRSLPGIQASEVVPAHTKRFWRWIWAPGGRKAAAARGRARLANPLALIGNPPESMTLEQIAALPNGEAAIERLRQFHDAEPGGVLFIDVPGGGDEIRTVVGLGYVPETQYFTDDDWADSNKRGALWIHEHPEGKEPIEVLDPETGLTLKLPTHKGMRVTDWWRE